MSIKLGITGGIGSGKSVVSHLLEIMGVPVYIADTESKRLTATDPQIRCELTDLLGEEVYRNGKLNKPFLANYLFSDPEHAQKVNGIIHPRVKEDFRQWIDVHKQAPVIAMEAAILIEAGFADDVDYIVMVYAPWELRIERAMKRDNSSREAIVKRIESQMSDEKKKAQAHHIIINDDIESIIPQIEALLQVVAARFNNQT
ncbi:dephospho-CoA kinase [Bacteroides sp. 51]|uniref:dephospho-CoA kinase n=1 Tax=Bacteroides sp. 51 TaxID=2302938 RepID=UPI0013D6A6DE|nr:dephospho-CoA kinase [Bacteroides sp. 51]NDV83860.1 dephospho-CoA kinase [Bacteroides sp. 51]